MAETPNAPNRGMQHDQNGGTTMWKRLYGFTLLLFVAVCIGKAPAQVTSAGSIAGQVVDSTGALVPTATVVAIQAQTNAHWKTISDSGGSYIFPNLPVGTFTLSAQKEGFSTAQINTVILNAGDQLRQNFTLKPGAVTDTVQVSSDAISVDTESANVGEVVSNTAIEALPLITRNFIELVEIAPGVSSDIGSEPGFGSGSSLAVSVNGVRNNANNWTIDGVPNLDVFNGNNAIIPDEDALAEFRVDRGNYTAEQGRSAGATVNAILKSGTNDWHGSAFEFLRNTDLDANTYFNKISPDQSEWGARPSEHYNNFGYTAGGPIKKDKLFFFWSQEFRRLIQPVGTVATRVPTDQEKNDGDFSDYASIGMSEPLVTTALAANPLCVGCVAGKPFPNDTIPSGLLSKNAQLLLKTYYPSAGTYNASNGTNFSSSASTTTNTREELIRMDYNLSDKWKMFAHYVQDQNHIASPYGLWGENVLPHVGSSTEFEPMQSFAFNIVGTLSPNLINEAQFGIYHNIIRIQTSPLLNRDLASGLDIPYYFPNHVDPQNRIPAMSFGHYAGIQTIWPFLNGFFYHKWTDNVSWHRGNHNLRFGLLVTQQGKNEDNAPNNLNGTFSFSGTAYDGIHTGNDMSDMLTNFADSYSESMNNPVQHLRYWDDEVYGQDQWQISHRLSLTFGLRYTYFGPEIDQNNLLTNFLPQLYESSLAPTVDPSSGNLTNIQPSQLTNGVYMPNNGIIAAGVNSPWGEAVFNIRKLNIAPRAGFSYDLFGKGKTAVRGGYGMYYDRTAPYELYAKANPPFNAVVTLHSVKVDTPGQSGGAPINSTVGLFGFTAKQPLPYNQQWSLGIQQEVYRNTVVNLDYIGTRGIHLMYDSMLNQNTPNLQVAQGAINVDSVRPYQGYGTIQMVTPEAYSNYNGLQASVREQLGTKLTMNAAYTYSKVLTNASGDLNSVQNPLDPKADKGPASFDRTHMLVFNYVWQLPALSGSNFAMRTVLGGWQWSSLMNVKTGEPVTVGLGVYANAGETDGPERPNQIGKATDYKGLNDWISPSAFSVPAQATFGNASQGNVRLPRNTQVDSSLTKNFKLHERFNLEFKIEAINALNHTEFNSVDNNYYPGSTTFGHLNNTGLPRISQAGLHLMF
jgi:hypothetical protein